MIRIVALSTGIAAVLLLCDCVQVPTVIEPDVYIPDYAVTLTADIFDSLVVVENLVSMVDFFSPECPDCRAMDSVVDSLAKRFGGRGLIGRVNVLEEDSLRRAWAIGTIPAFVFMRGGAEYSRIIGAVAQDSLAAVLERGLAGAN